MGTNLSKKDLRSRVCHKSRSEKVGPWRPVSGDPTTENLKQKRRHIIHGGYGKTRTVSLSDWTTCQSTKFDRSLAAIREHDMGNVSIEKTQKMMKKKNVELFVITLIRAGQEGKPVLRHGCTDLHQAEDGMHFEIPAWVLGDSRSGNPIQDWGAEGKTQLSEGECVLGKCL